MTTTRKIAMDSAGRLLLPKAICEEAGFRPGYPLEITSEEGRVEIRPAPAKIEIVNGGDGLPLAVPREPVETLTTETVRQTLESLRARRGER